MELESSTAEQQQQHRARPSRRLAAIHSQSLVALTRGTLGSSLQQQTLKHTYLAEAHGSFRCQQKCK